jgi:hypothetical protein
VNFTDDEIARRKVYGSQTVIKEVKRIRNSEIERALDQTDQEHADRISSVEHRIAVLLVKRRKYENYEENTKVGNLEQRVDAVADAADVVKDEKTQQTDLIKSLKESAERQTEEMKAEIRANIDHVSRLAADEANRMVIAHSILPPEGVPLPTDIKGANPFSDVVRAGAVPFATQDPHLTGGPPVLGPDAVEADVVPSVTEVVAIPVPLAVVSPVAVPVAVISPDLSVRPEIRN